MRAEIGSTPRTAGIGPVQDFSFSSFFDRKGSIFDKNRVENRYIQFGPLLSLLVFFSFPFFSLNKNYCLERVIEASHKIRISKRGFKNLKIEILHVFSHLKSTFQPYWKLILKINFSLVFFNHEIGRSIQKLLK